MIQDTRLGFQATALEKVVTIPSTVADLFQALNDAGIKYCHWKSNLRLERGLQGKTDLDLLVDPDDRQPFLQMLERFRVIPVLAPPGKRYPSIEDYLGFDPLIGCLFHFHVHYQLVLGEQFVKNYHLPLERQFLTSTRIQSGVKVPSPELELIVLSLRALLKYRDRDAIKDFLSIRSSGLPSHILDEIHWLFDQTSLEKISRTLEEISDVIPIDLVLGFIDTILASPRDGLKLYRLRQRARQIVSPYQRHNRLRAMAGYFWEAWHRRKSFLRFTPGHKMTLPGAGLTVALVGTDGAGKTTLTGELDRWLSWKMDVRRYYLGSKQPSRMSNLAYTFFRIARRCHRSLSGMIGENRLLTRIMENLRQTLLYAHYIFIGYDRYRRYLAGSKHASKGSIVIFDRYPMEAPLDGPQIHLAAGANPGITARALISLERGIYQKFQMPDLLCILEVSPEISLQRKPDHRQSAIETKNQLLKKLADTFQGRPGVRLQRIDADIPLEQVTLQIKNAIWGALANLDPRP